MSEFGKLLRRARELGAYKTDFVADLAGAVDRAVVVGDGVCGAEGSWACTIWYGSEGQCGATGRTGEEALRFAVRALESATIDPGG